jgi:hypothetical protein
MIILDARSGSELLPAAKCLEHRVFEASTFISDFRLASVMEIVVYLEVPNPLLCRYLAAHLNLL